MDRIYKHITSTLATVTGLKSAGHVAVELGWHAIQVADRAGAYLLRLAGVMPAGLQPKPWFRLHPALVPANPCVLRRSPAQPRRPEAGRRSEPGSGTRPQQ